MRAARRSRNVELFGCFIFEMHEIVIESARPVTSLSNATAKLRNQQQRTTIERLELEIFMHLRHSLAIINHINLISKSSQRQTPMMICAAVFNCAVV